MGEALKSRSRLLSISIALSTLSTASSYVFTFSYDIRSAYFLCFILRLLYYLQMNKLLLHFKTNSDFMWRNFCQILSTVKA